ncbi:MAG: Gfo/Idh/MocA family oxidoreductase [Deltaproteobacteria bacterium]|nr:Gfo/Idh/MocA family oxidoreductase [Deltaproteobacteria bacterium]
MKDDTPHIAVVGAGYWGKNLIRNYSELGALHAICESNEETCRSIEKTYPEVPCVKNFQALLNMEDIDGVAIAAPAEKHFSLAREALLAGKDVFVEKPLALSLSDAQELKEIAESHSRILMVGHLLQFHPAFIGLKELIRNGELGRIHYIYSNRLSFGKIRREEDILWSFAPHDISMILALSGEEPDCVMATGGNYLHKKIADVTTTHLEFSSGLRAHVFVSWLHPFKEQTLVVVGERQMAVFKDTAPWGEKLFIYPHNILWQNGIPVPEKKDAISVSVQRGEPLKTECEHFLKCIIKRTRPTTDADEGISVLRILKAGQDSLLGNGKKIVIREMHKKQDAFFVHDTSIIDNGASIGAGTKIWHFSHILKNSKIGADCSIGQNVVIGPDAIIGKGCKIQNNVSIYKGVTLEDSVFCGPSMVFTNVFNPRAHIPRMDEMRPTLVKQGATIGANATIVCGHTIGSYAFIGAGAVVNRGAPDHALMVGNPARQIGWMCECGNKLDDTLTCLHCGMEYEISATGTLGLKSTQHASIING